MAAHECGRILPCTTVCVSLCVYVYVNVSVCVSEDVYESSLFSTPPKQRTKSETDSLFSD